jgi:hypothetical protein
MADYGKRVKSLQRYAETQASSKFVHVDNGTVTVSSTGCSLVGVILNTNGAAITLRTGSRVIGIIAADAPEGSFPYGVYCENGLIVECGGAVSATVKFD